MAEFVKAASVDQVQPGKSVVRNMGGKDIAIFNLNGEFFAICNDCPHVGGPLGEGYLRGSVVTCPLHGWQFDIKTGKSPLIAAEVECYEVKVENGEILIAI